MPLHPKRWSPIPPAGVDMLGHSDRKRNTTGGDGLRPHHLRRGSGAFIYSVPGSAGSGSCGTTWCVECHRGVVLIDCGVWDQLCGGRLLQATATVPFLIAINEFDSAKVSG